MLGGQGGIIRYSSDGIVWNTATSNTTQTISYIRGIVYTEGLFYAVMYTSAGKGEIWVSTDAQTWTVQYSASGRVWCVATGGDVIFASGDNGTIYRLDLDVEWLDYEPELTEGKYLWKRLYVVLTDGVKVLGENIMERNARKTNVPSDLDSTYAKITYVDSLVGGINEVLDNINGEVI